MLWRQHFLGCFMLIQSLCGVDFVSASRLPAVKSSGGSVWNLPTGKQSEQGLWTLSKTRGPQRSLQFFGIKRKSASGGSTPLGSDPVRDARAEQRQYCRSNYSDWSQATHGKGAYTNVKVRKSLCLDMLEALMPHCHMSWPKLPM